MIEADRIKLANILAAVDENFLVALANKGLVRRAQKDLEGQTLQIEELANAIEVRGSDWTVLMPADGPAKATDDTIATGITRQILAATIYLRDHWAPAQTKIDAVKVPECAEAMPKLDCYTTSPKIAPTAAESTVASSESIVATENSVKSSENSAASSENSVAGNEERESVKIQERLLAITFDDLSKWAGKKLVSDLAALLNESVELEVESKLGLLLRLPQHSIEVRIMPSTIESKGTRLLDGILSTAPTALHKKWVATAIVLLQRRAGRTLVQTTSSLTECESPKSQIQILQESRTLLASMLDIGVAHPSPRLIERLFTLSLSASAAQLPRLSKSLKTISDQVAHLVSKNVAADSQQLLSTMSRTYSLIKALESYAERNKLETNTVIDFPSELAGVVRTKYDPVGDIRLMGIGAHIWQTKSGFTGMTCLFWAPEKQRFFTWSTSRPSNTFSLSDAEQAYRIEPIWSSQSPESLCRSSFTLKDARVNPSGRISNTQETSVVDVIKNPQLHSNIFDRRAFTDFYQAKTYAVQQFPVGLRISNELDRIVILEPKVWGERLYDEMRQRFYWDIFDSAKQLVRLTLPWTTSNEKAITFLESLKPALDKIIRVVARIEVSAEEVSFEPLSLLSTGTRSGDTVLNPHFDQKLIEIVQSGLLDRLRAKFGRQPRIETVLSDEESWDNMHHSLDASKYAPTHLLAALSETEDLLLQTAEAGTKRLNQRLLERFEDIGAKLSHCGLSELGESIQSIARAPGSCSEFVLWSEYLCALHRQSLFLKAL